MGFQRRLVFEDAPAAEALYESALYDAVILDLTLLPGMDGRDILREWRERVKQDLRKGALAEARRGLHLGADDYLSNRAFQRLIGVAARLEALVRRQQSGQ